MQFTQVKWPNRLRELREGAGLSQQNLAQRIGVSKVTISELERGKMRLDVQYMRRLAAALEVKAADLLQVEDNPDSLDQFERRLIEHLRQATIEERQAVDTVINLLIVSAPHHGKRSPQD